MGQDTARRPLAERLRWVEGSTAFVHDVPAEVTAFAGSAASARSPAWWAVGVVDAAAIERIAPEIDERYVRGATLWMLYPKRSGAIATDISRDHGWAPLASRGFVPVAQVSVDGTWSALRFRKADEVSRMTRKAPIGEAPPRRRGA